MTAAIIELFKEIFLCPWPCCVECRQLRVLMHWVQVFDALFPTLRVQNKPLETLEDTLLKIFWNRIRAEMKHWPSDDKKNSQDLLSRGGKVDMRIYTEEWRVISSSTPNITLVEMEWSRLTTSLDLATCDRWWTSHRVFGSGCKEMWADGSSGLIKHRRSNRDIASAEDKRAEPKHTWVWSAIRDKIA